MVKVSKNNYKRTSIRCIDIPNCDNNLCVATYFVDTIACTSKWSVHCTGASIVVGRGSNSYDIVQWWERCRCTCSYSVASYGDHWCHV